VTFLEIRFHFAADVQPRNPTQVVDLTSIEIYSSLVNAGYLYSETDKNNKQQIRMSRNPNSIDSCIINCTLCVLESRCPAAPRDYINAIRVC
jgi:hypothetical protein